MIIGRLSRGFAMNSDEEYIYIKICDKLGFDPMK